MLQLTQTPFAAETASKQRRDAQSLSGQSFLMPTLSTLQKRRKVCCDLSLECSETANYRYCLAFATSQRSRNRVFSLRSAAHAISGLSCEEFLCPLECRPNQRLGVVGQHIRNSQTAAVHPLDDVVKPFCDGPSRWLLSERIAHQVRFSPTTAPHSITTPSTNVTL